MISQPLVNTHFVLLCSSFFGAVIMRTSYGLEVAGPNDRHIFLAERGVDIFSLIMVPGRYLVEAIPTLRHIPAWFPGAQFKRDANVWKKEISALLHEPFAITLDQLVCIARTLSH